MKSFQLANSAFYSGIVLRTIFGFLPFWLIFFIVESMKNFLHLSIAFFNVSMIIQTSFILNHEWVHKYTDEVSTTYSTFILFWIDKLQLFNIHFFNLGNIEDHPDCCCWRVNAHRNSWLYFGKIHHNPIKCNIVSLDGKWSHADAFTRGICNIFRWALSAVTTWSEIRLNCEVTRSKYPGEDPTKMTHKEIF